MLQEKKSTTKKSRIKKNIMEFYKKGSNSSNHLKLRSILSIFAIGVFIFFGFASIEEKPPAHCDFYKNPIAKTQIITIEFVDRQTGSPIVNQNINFHVEEYQNEINSDFNCWLVLKKSNDFSLNSGSSGKATITLNKAYVSSEDLIQINTHVISKNYNGTFLINIYDYVSNQTVRYGILKTDQYP